MTIPKKAAALALALTISLSTVVSAFAESGEDINDTLPTIEITLPQEEQGEEQETASDDGSVTGSSVTESEQAEDRQSDMSDTSSTSVSTSVSTSKVTSPTKASTKPVITTSKKTTASTSKVTTKKTTTTTKKVVPAKTVKLTQSAVLYKGEKRKLDILAAKKGKVTVKTANKKIVAVSGTTIKAKKSGSTKVTVTVKSGRNTYIVTINITVKVSSYDSSVSYKASKTSSSRNVPALIWHREVKAGKSFKLSVSGYDKVTFSSSDSKIASVSSKGKVTAKKKGTALIKANVKAGSGSYTFYTQVHVYKSKPAPKVTQAQINSFFGASGFIGSSIGVGQQMYFDSQGYSFLGHPTMMVRGCYAFHNDGGANGSQYQISCGGYTGPARYCVQRSKVKRVFINMGTNDMMGDADYVFNNYVNYISGIRSVNPKVPIYIEAMTPVYAGGQKGYLNNATVNALNAKLAAYCRKKSDMYFIDINTPLKAGTGSLPAAYSSDNYVHLTAAAYAVWTDTIVDYVKKQLIAEQRAKDAVKTYTESKTAANLKTAKKYVKKLEASALKTKLQKKLK